MRIRILLFSSVIFKMSTKNSFFCLLLFKGTFTSFSKIKVIQKSQNSRKQCFSYYFCLMIEGSGAGAGSGSMSLTNGSGWGSRRPKNIWILRIRIRIRNTDLNHAYYTTYDTSLLWTESWINSVLPTVFLYVFLCLCQVLLADLCEMTGPLKQCLRPWNPRQTLGSYGRRFFSKLFQNMTRKRLITSSATM